MNHNPKSYEDIEESPSMAKEAMPRYNCQTVPMSHVQMSFGLDVPTHEDVETLKLRVIAFAEYLSSKEKRSVEDKAIRQINKLMLLEDNWDGYGSPQVDTKAARNAIDLVRSVDRKFLRMLRITPTETGSVSLRFLRGENDTIGINCGQNSMSYFIEKEKCQPEFYSDLDYSDQNIQSLIRRMEKW